jgi:aryl-alcohol dehydrogenase-like predicted oxidoreductase
VNRRAGWNPGTKWAVGMMRDEPFTVRGTSRKAMVRSLEESLRRLGTDYVDVLWTHGYDDKVPVEEIMLGFDRLVTAGKIRYGGLGTHPAWKVARAATIAEIRGWAPMAAITTEYGPSERDAERELLPAAEAMGFGVLAWSPLGGGFLARDGQGDGGPASHLQHWFRHGRPAAKDLAVHAAVRETAAEAGESSAAVGYAWLLNRARHSATGLIPVIGATTPDQLRQDCARSGSRSRPSSSAGSTTPALPGSASRTCTTSTAIRSRRLARSTSRRSRSPDAPRPLRKSREVTVFSTHRPIPCRPI